jgi:hypothetical protein
LAAKAATRVRTSVDFFIENSPGTVFGKRQGDGDVALCIVPRMYDQAVMVP